MSRRPRVLAINTAYPPGRGATGELLAELAVGLRALEWDVEVVAGPVAGEPAHRTVDGVEVFRTAGAALDAASRPPVVVRAARLGLAMPRLVRLALERARQRPDVVLTMTDPPLGFAAGPWLARVAGAPVVHWAQDVYPEVAGALGVFPPDGGLARALRRLATRALRRHDAVVAVGRCMKETLVARGLDPSRVHVIPNWALEGIEPVDPDANAFRAEHVPPGAFAVAYSGNMGLAHPLGPILDAAAELATTDPDVVWLLIGDGARRVWVEREVKGRRLGNVRVLPFQPRDRLAESLSAGDLHVVTMAPELEGLVVPSKAYGVLRAGRPILFAGPEGSEVARMIGEDGTGEVVALDGAALAAAVRRWRDDPARRAAARATALARAASGRADAIAAFDAMFRQLLRASSA